MAIMLGYLRRARKFLGRVRAYAGCLRTQVRARPNRCSTLYSILAFRRWRRSLDRSPLADGVPWITFESLDFIGRYLQKTHRVFEFGAGGSTVYFAARAATVTSVEHQKEWHQAVLRTLAERNLTNCDVNFVPPLPKGSEPSEYGSADAPNVTMDFKGYASFIDRYPARHFDIVLVDGRARPACIRHAIDKVRAGGLLILDNSERERYAVALKELDTPEWECLHFFGPGAYNHYSWRTTIWKRKVA